MHASPEVLYNRAHQPNTRVGIASQLELYDHLQFDSMPGQNSDLRYFSNVVHCVPRYEIHEDKFEAYDPVWGHETIGEEPGDDLILEILEHPAMKRLMTVEQLTLPPEYSTIPNTTQFTRYEHSIGAMILVRKMIRRTNELQSLTERERVVLQLRALLADISHSTGSHAGDWLKEDTFIHGIIAGTKTEKSHDNEQQTFLEHTKIDEILMGSSYKITLEEILVQGNDWVEKSGKLLCVDRLDFSVREILRTYGEVLTPEDKALLAIDNFTVVDNQLVATNFHTAFLLARLYMLLSSEHWGEPLHKGNLKYYCEFLRAACLDRDHIAYWTAHVFTASTGHSYSSVISPLDVLYGEDSSFDGPRNSKKVDFRWRNLDFFMRSIASSRREWFDVFLRGSLYENFIKTDLMGDWWAPVYLPDPAGHYSGPVTNSVAVPPYVDLQVIRDGSWQPNPNSLIDDIQANDEGLVTFLPTIKARYIVPDYTEDGEIKSLASMPAFIEYTQQLESYLGRVYRLTYRMSKDDATDIRSGIAESRKIWKEQIKVPRLQAEPFKRIIDFMGSVAVMNRLNDVEHLA